MITFPVIVAIIDSLPSSVLPVAISVLPPRAPNTPTINTSAKCRRNTSQINTYKIAGLKVEQNQHLQKKAGGGCADPAIRNHRRPKKSLRGPSGWPTLSGLGLERVGPFLRSGAFQGFPLCRAGGV